MPKCDFNIVALQLYWNRTSKWVFSGKFTAYFQNTFSSKHLRMAASVNLMKWNNWKEKFTMYLQKQPPEVFYEKIFLEISQNSQENTCASLFFNKVAGLRPATLLKNTLWHRCFPVNFAKFPRTCGRAGSNQRLCSVNPILKIKFEKAFDNICKMLFK